MDEIYQSIEDFRAWASDQGWNMVYLDNTMKFVTPQGNIVTCVINDNDMITDVKAD